MARLKESGKQLLKNVSLTIEPRSMRLLADQHSQYVADNTEASFPFMALPPELRNRVYEFLFSDGLIHITPAALYQRPIERYPTQDETTEEVAKLVMQPAITRTNGVLRREALPVFYEATIFYLPVGGYCFVNKAVVVWLSAIGPENRLAIRKLYVRGETGHAAVLEGFAKALGKTFRMKTTEIDWYGRAMPSMWPFFKLFFEPTKGEER